MTKREQDIFQQKKIAWIDSHAHVDKLSLKTSNLIKQAKQANVYRIITIGTELKDWQNVVKLSQSYQPEIYGALGMHPHSAKDFNQTCEDFLRKHLTHKRIVAIGEIGLDYYYNNSQKKVQREVFEKQMYLAKELNLPVEIHTRKAEQDTALFLKQFKGHVKGLLHCFTSSYDLAKKALDYGFNISFSGILTFKNAEDLRQTCKKIPLNRLHIETDSPFLSPEPYRGKENQPTYTALVANAVAKLHNVDLVYLSHQLKSNTFDLFYKIKKEELC